MAQVPRGVREDRLRERLGRFTDTMHYVPSDAALWQEATALARRLDRKGRVFAPPSMLA